MSNHYRDTGWYGGEKEPWARHLSSNGEQMYGDGDTVVSREDLIEAGGMAYDGLADTWAFPVVGSVGYPRRTLGIFMLRLTGEGELVVSLE